MKLTPISLRIDEDLATPNIAVFPFFFLFGLSYPIILSSNLSYILLTKHSILNYKLIYKTGCYESLLSNNIIV